MQLTPFLSEIAVFAENTTKIAFSARGSFCVSQIVTPLFYTHSKEPSLEGGGVQFLGFP